MKVKAIKLKKSNKSWQGFTLLEAMVGLMVLSLSMLLFTGLLENAKFLEKYLAHSEEKNWSIFLLQLESECRGYNINEVKSNQIKFVHSTTNEAFFLKYKNGKIIKSKNKGYQPLLLNVKAANFEKSTSGAKLSVLLENGIEKQSNLTVNEGVNIEEK